MQCNASGTVVLNSTLQDVRAACPRPQERFACWGLGKRKERGRSSPTLFYFLLVVATQSLLLLPKMQQCVLEEGGPGAALGHKPKEPAVKDRTLGKPARAGALTHRENGLQRWEELSFHLSLPADCLSRSFWCCHSSESLLSNSCPELPTWSHLHLAYAQVRIRERP